MSALPYWKSVSTIDEFGMAWPARQYSNGEVHRAGKILRANKLGTLCQPDELRRAYEVLSNWRACHNYPINTLRKTLNDRLKQVAPEAYAAQRLKRMPSIETKLVRFPTMKLHQMQDIGGLRAVVRNQKQIRALLKLYEGSGPHILRSQSANYIDAPKTDGYRSVHLIYEYQNSRTPQYNGMFVELQIRTRLQHAWATAVEVVSTIINQALKMNQGEDAWKEFFKLASAAFSHLEKAPVLEEYRSLSKLDIYRRLAESENQLQVIAKLHSLARASSTYQAQTEDGSPAAFYLIVLDLNRMSLVIRPFTIKQQDIAVMEYAKLEKEAASGQAIDTVFVTGESLATLKNVFANYWLDTVLFVKSLERVIMETTQS